MKKKIIGQILINIIFLGLVLVIYKGVSYASEDDLMQDNKDLLVKTGNMQVVLSVPKEKYEFLDGLKLSVSDEVGQRQDGYNFTITNTGNIPIEYYEIRLVDEENKISTLPHKYLRFTIKKDNDNYSSIKNLGDNESIIYQGDNLLVGDSANFNLKMWITNVERDVSDKKLYSALEVTLYQKNEIQKNFILYDSEDSYNMPSKTSIYEPISSIIPKRDGYNFLGWSNLLNGEVIYQKGDTYMENKGMTLYAVWEKIN